MDFSGLFIGSDGPYLDVLFTMSMFIALLLSLFQYLADMVFCIAAYFRMLFMALCVLPIKLTIMLDV